MLNSLIGTIVNSAAIITGSLIGTGVHCITLRSGRAIPSEASLSSRLRDMIMKAISLFALYIGVYGILNGQNGMIILLSLIFGALIGETLDLDGRLLRFASVMEKRLLKNSGDGTSTFAEGFVSASLLFCVGAMSIVGALQDGLQGDHSMLFTKAVMDGISSIIFASTFGIGVLLSVIVVFFYQGVIAIGASLLAPYLGNIVIGEMTCVGSILIIALGLNILGATKIKLMNLVPACLLPILFCQFM